MLPPHPAVDVGAHRNHRLGGLADEHGEQADLEAGRLECARRRTGAESLAEIVTDVHAWRRNRDQLSIGVNAEDASAV